MSLREPRASFCEDNSKRPHYERRGILQMVYDEGVLCYNIIIVEVEN